MGEAGKQGFLENLSSDIRNCKLTKCSVVYKGQSKAGDKLDIPVWQDGADELTNENDEFLTNIKVEIEKNGKTLCTAHFTFMRDQLISHL